MSRFPFALAILLAGILPATALDPHAIYERACARCHLPDAGPFVRETLTIDAGRIVSTADGRDIAAFLERGHGRLAPQEAEALIDHFRAILSSGGLYDDKCRTCHDRAVVLARRHLFVSGGAVVGRYSGRDIAAFLTGHGRLSEAEIGVILAMLERQLRTADE